MLMIKSFIFLKNFSFLPVCEGVTHSGVPLYRHTHHQEDGAAHGDPKTHYLQTNILLLIISYLKYKICMLVPVERVVCEGKCVKQPGRVELYETVTDTVKYSKYQVDTENNYH